MSNISIKSIFIIKVILVNAQVTFVLYNKSNLHKFLPFLPSRQHGPRAMSQIYKNRLTATLRHKCGSLSYSKQHAEHSGERCSREKHTNNHSITKTNFALSLQRYIFSRSRQQLDPGHLQKQPSTPCRAVFHSIF